LVDEKTKETVGVKVEVKPDIPSEEKMAVTSVPLTQHLFDLHSYSIREQFRLAGKNMELAILDQPITVRDGGEVVLEVMGHVQEEIAGKMKTELVRWIREFTGASRVVISVELKEELPSGKPMLYTNTDKLNFLREKHPALAEFQRKFGLEVDF
jgi:hypothetical protein